MNTSTDISIVQTNKAASPQGHYSQAVIHGDTIYVAMQIAIDPKSGPIVGPVDLQAAVALNNVKQILEAAGSSLNKVLRVTIYLSDINFWEDVNTVYSKVFSNHKPARGVVTISKLHLGMDVGFEVTAAK